jgi:hypothetical protein
LTVVLVTTLLSVGARVAVAIVCICVLIWLHWSRVWHSLELVESQESSSTIIEIMSRWCFLWFSACPATALEFFQVLLAIEQDMKSHVNIFSSAIYDEAP